MEQQRASQRYEETWLAFTEELKSNPTVTLRAICKKLHTNQDGMSKWASNMVIQSAAARLHYRKRQVPHHTHSFVSNRKIQPVQHQASVLAGVCVTFSSGTTISISRRCGRIIRLVNLYEQRRMNHVFSNVTNKYYLFTIHPD